MIPLLALLLVAAPQRLLLVEETVEVPPKTAKGLTAVLQQQRAVIEVVCRPIEGEDLILIILPPEGAGARPVYVQPPRPEDHPYRYLAMQPGEYQVVVENRGEAPARVALKVTLVFGAPGAAEPFTLPEPRRRLVVGMSLLFLAAIGWISARRILPLFRRPPHGPLRLS